MTASDQAATSAS